MPSGDGTPRIYSVVADTTGGVLNTEMLLAEIEAEAAITTAIRTRADGGWLYLDGDVADLHFSAALSGAEITALDAVVLAHQGTATTRTFQFFESNPKQTEATTTWSTKMSRTVAAVGAGTYVISWRYELKLELIGQQNSKAEAQVLIDSNLKGSSTTECGGAEAQTGEDWVDFSGFDRLVLAEGDAPVIDIQIRQQPTAGGNDTVAIRKMKIGVRLVD